jgi:putative cardiolipin synthase
VDQALAEIERLRGRHLYFLDDHLFGDVRFAAELFEGMRGMGRLWQAAGTVQSVLRPELLEKAVACGLRSLFVGFETLDVEGLRAQRNLDMVSPYFVPGEDGARALEELARSGVKVRVLTNSFAATDVSVVHAGYAKRRCGLARAGVALYELKGTGKAEAKRASGGRSGSSATSLHAKTYAADGERVFIGSFNFDMRSALLNTEMGLVIRSPALASRLARHFEEELRSDAYEVRPSQEGGCVVWIERSDGAELRHENEPGAGFLRRMWLGFLSLLPIDWML